VSEHTPQPPAEGATKGRELVTRANLAAYLGDSARKQELVTPLFDLIAPGYDRFTRTFSYGMDSRWKRQLVEWLAKDVGPQREVHVLDVACGTGDLAVRTARALPRALVHGIDISLSMLQIARLRVDGQTHGRLSFAEGDVTRLEARSASLDVVTAGYAIRNVADPQLALGELARVLRRGGRLYVLDFFRPAPRLWRGLYLGYLRAAGAAVGWCWHRAPAAYEYIAVSIAHYVSWEQFTSWLTAAGFRVAAVEPKLWGGVALIAAERR
jgi:demethylmenaquinone methyltransferase/2-methoxy-6-polyprenyl-1,4-benzoquinol methylase